MMSHVMFHTCKAMSSSIYYLFVLKKTFKNTYSIQKIKNTLSLSVVTLKFIYCIIWENYSGIKKRKADCMT